MNDFQKIIVQALEALGEKQNFTEAVLAKKIRELTGFDGKKHGGIPLADLEVALECAADSSGVCYAVHVNQANVILVERKAVALEEDASCVSGDSPRETAASCVSGDSPQEGAASCVSAGAALETTSLRPRVTVSPEAKKRRLASEKSQVLFTAGDFSSGSKSSGKSSGKSALKTHKKAKAKAHHQTRGERRSININSNFEDMEGDMDEY